MKKLKKIELTKLDLHPEQKMTFENMKELHGGAGCICYKKSFNVNGSCACHEKSFGLCNVVNGGSYDPTYGYYGNV